jgi:hypothetical protein
MLTDNPKGGKSLLRQADARLSGTNCADWRSRIWRDLHSGHKAHSDKRNNQGVDCWRNGGLVIRLLRINGDRNSNWVASGDHHVIDQVAVVPPGLSKDTKKVQRKVLRLIGVCQGRQLHFLPCKWRQNSDQFSLLWWRKVSWCLLNLKIGYFLVRFRQLLLNRLNFRLAARFGCGGILLALLVGSVFAGCDQSLSPLGIYEGHNLAQREQSNERERSYMKPEIDGLNGVQRVPTRKDHDYFPLVIAWAASMAFAIKLTWLIANRKRFWRG